MQAVGDMSGESNRTCNQASLHYQTCQSALLPLQIIVRKYPRSIQIRHLLTDTVDQHQMNLIKFVYDSIESWLFCISIPTMTSLVRSCLFLTSSPNVANPMSVARRNGLPAKFLYCWGGWQKSHRKLRLIYIVILCHPETNHDSVLLVTTLESPSLETVEPC